MREWLRGRIGVVIAAIVVLVVLFADRIAAFFTDLWWFDALGHREVFTTLLLTKIGIGIVFGLVLGLLVAGNLMVARRMRPLFVPSSPREAAVQRYREMADPYLPWLILGIAALFALTSGFAVSAQWEPFLLWRNAQSFGVDDPQFQRDVGFYVFRLPWLKFVQTWLFTSLLLVTLLTAGAHYLLGGIRPDASGEKVLPNVKVHLSVLLALLLAVRGWGYWLDRYMLNFSPRGTVTGASYTDVNAELPALTLLLVVTGVAIVLVLYNVRRRGWLLPGAAIGLLVAASIVLQGAYPAVIQRLRVDPQELSQEREFIQRNLEATRAAYDIGGADLRIFEIRNDLDRQDIEENQVTLDNVRLWDPGVLQTTFQELQSLRPYYQFVDVDIDRYEVDGQLRQVGVAARELSLGSLQPGAQTWQNLKTFYTHGFGLVASLVNTATPEGQPQLLARDLPPGGADSLVTDSNQGNALYYSEAGNEPYSLVDTAAEELDFEDPQTNQPVITDYAGEGGVSIGGLVRRLAFAVRFSDPNVVLTDLLTADSRLLMRRDVPERVNALAPYLELDGDPYPVMLDDRIVWVQDAFTTATHYPYSERRPFQAATGRSTVNYVRNSVKAVVDAYDGTVELYVVDDQDPVVQAWSQIFPDLYTPVAQAPDGLAEHFRYPEDLFQIQSDLYTTYHIEGAGPFYSKADEWEVPPDPSQEANREQLADGSTRLRPFYLLMRLPGQEDEEFVLIQPYKPRDRPNMVGWLAGRSDPGHYGELFAVRFPTDQQVLGPGQAQARIEQESEISSYITLRSQAGSRVIRGNLLVLPVGRSILYIEPLFLESPQAQIPELDRVVIVMGGRTVFEPTLDGALASLVGAEPPDEDGDGDGGDGGPAPTVGPAIQDALELFQQAQQALEQGDLGTYQQRIEEARQRLEDAAREEGLPTPGETATPTPAPTATPTGAG